MKQSEMGQGDAVDRWNALNAPLSPVASPFEIPLCDGHRIGLKPDRLYQFQVEAGCASCAAWAAYAAGEGPEPRKGGTSGGPDAELLRGWTRYEKARKLTLRQWADLHARNVVGEQLDDMIDALDEPSSARTFS